MRRKQLDVDYGEREVRRKALAASGWDGDADDWFRYGFVQVVV